VSPVTGSLGNSVSDTAANAITQLAGLKVAPQNGSGYQRDLFYKSWGDADDYGWTGVPLRDCTVREAALMRDGSNVTYNPSNCAIESGTWTLPYTGSTVTLTKTQISSQIQIDHVVPLGEAWASGASAWTSTQRRDYAFDPLVVLSASSKANEEKSDDDVAQWTPPLASADCGYAIRWVDIKSKYQLSVDQAEHDKLASMLAGCAAGADANGGNGNLGAATPAGSGTGSDSTRTTAAAANPAPVAQPAAPATQAAANSGVCPANCTEAKKEGMTNIHRGDRCYQKKLDRDNDGVACEA
jgi:hypothetical protein